MPQTLRTNLITFQKRQRLQSEMSKLEKFISLVASKIYQLRKNMGVKEAEAYEALQAEYDYAWHRLNEINYILSNTKAVGEGRKSTAQWADIGSNVEIRFSDSGITQKFRLVGAMDADQSRGLVAINSAVGRELYGKREGEEAVLETSGGPQICEIVRIN